MISETELQQDLILVKKAANRVPTKSLYREKGRFHPETVIRHFGSWNNALLETFGTVNSQWTRKPVRKCEHCQKETKNKKYCSKSCAAIVNNSLYPKNPRRNFCQKCGQSSSRRLCRMCFRKSRAEEAGEKTIADFSSTYARHRYQAIRNHAHQIARLYFQGPKECSVCGYSLHVELCHKKPINQFPRSTKLKVVNNISNLVYLCRNHHWETEHGFLDL